MAPHEARGIDAALGEIEQNAGRLYDSEAVGACLHVFRDKGCTLPAQKCGDRPEPERLFAAAVCRRGTCVRRERPPDASDDLSKRLSSCSRQAASRRG